MKLTAFRIRHCFGFRDSGWVSLASPRPLFYVLGRNSSGKTSLLQALRHFDIDLIPHKYDKAENFDSDDEQASPRLLGRFKVRKGDLDLSRHLDAVERAAMRSGLSAVPEGQIRSGYLRQLRELVEESYEPFIKAALNAKETSVRKYMDGTYQHILDLRDYGPTEERIQGIQRGLERLAPNSKLNLGKDGERPITLSANDVEKCLFAQFPRVRFFGEDFALDEDLPDRLTIQTVRAPDSDIERAFVNYLGPELLTRVLRTEDPDKIDAALTELTQLTDKLCRLINGAKRRSVGSADLVDLVLHPRGGLQVTFKTEGKKSFYRHLSDNTKFLFAYFLYSAASPPENAVVLFDEPNRGFHPSAEAFILKFLKGLLVQKNQVVVSTHSQHLIDLDLLSNVRLMGTDPDNTLSVLDHPYRRAAGRGDFLALQPVYDAIGFRFAADLRLRNQLVLLEGITDFMYLRAFALRLGRKKKAALMPARSDAHILTLIPFLMAQSLSFKVVIDAGKMKDRLSQEYGMDGDSIFEIPVAERFEERVSTSGIEDLFTKKDFLGLLRRAGLKVDGRGFNRVPNSVFVKNKAAKRLAANWLLENCQRDDLEFEDSTLTAFSKVIKFIYDSGGWYSPP